MKTDLIEMTIKSVFLSNKVDCKHIATYIKNKSKIMINKKYYRVYKFIEN